MICAVDNCQRNDSKRRFKMGYCDAHYQRIYFSNDTKDDKPVKEYAKRGSGVELLKKVANTDSGVCIDWPYGKDSNGYGQVFYNKRRIKAHRVVLMIRDGEDPGKEVFACHKCDNSLCINPQHLYWGDAKSNAIDRFTFRT